MPNNPVHWNFGTFSCYVMQTHGKSGKHKFKSSEVDSYSSPGLYCFQVPASLRETFPLPRLKPAELWNRNKLDSLWISPSVNFALLYFTILLSACMHHNKMWSSWLFSFSLKLHSQRNPASLMQWHNGREGNLNASHIHSVLRLTCSANGSECYRSSEIYD